ncbi:MAG: hypothetical protein ACMG6H_13560 [Acidobacteriota bacterium]
MIFITPLVTRARLDERIRLATSACDDSAHLLREVDPRPEQFAAIDPFRLKAFGEPPYPNRNVVGVKWLAGIDFEIR